jgi:dTDP-4-amino-4,6-dideoxygalactose transaminase
VSTANAIVRLGAHPVFVDIRPDTLNLDERLIEAAVTERTRAILPVHYAGVACEMNAILEIARRHDLIVIEDAAQAVNAFYRGRALGSLGHLGCYSFHETKNYICGEGGALCVNAPEFIERAEILRDKGTNRKQFFRGLVDKYTWVDVGSSYVPSEIVCAFLYAQLEQLAAIDARRRTIHDFYRESLQPLAEAGLLTLPAVPADCESNAHLFYLLLPDERRRRELQEALRRERISAVFHYVPLHISPMGRRLGCADRRLAVTESVADRLLRLPLFYDLTPEMQSRVVEAIAAQLRGTRLKALPAAETDHRIAA